MMTFLGIDTSNYTTSASFCEDGVVGCNSKCPVFVKVGERGVRQSDAVFSHVKNMPEVMAVLGEKTYTAIGVSVRPRDVEGSYMPCFLAGQAVASSLSTTLGVPMYTFSHQAGHVRAALYSAGRNDLVDKTFLAFHISGGTTELLLYEKGSITCVGGTLDINAGQAIDRAGVMMGLQFPCGKEMEALANAYSGKLPASRICVKDAYCNLSGLQNLAEKLWRETGDRAIVSAFVFDFVGKTLSRMTKDLDARFSDYPVVYAGGVMSNRGLQSLLKQRKNTYFAEPSFSADNAAGVALLCRGRYLREHL